MLPETVRNYIHAHQSEAVETLSKLIGFPSVATPQPQDGFPYGKTAADALDFMLEQLSALGIDLTPTMITDMGAATGTAPCRPIWAFSATWTWFRQFRRTGLLIRSPPKSETAASTAEGPLTTKDRLWRSCTPSVPSKLPEFPSGKTSGSCWAATRKTAPPISPIIWRTPPCRRRYLHRTAAIPSSIWKRACSGCGSPNRPQTPSPASPPALRQTRSGGCLCQPLCAVLRHERAGQSNYPERGQTRLQGHCSPCLHTGER